jgi:hypothetical protein
MAIHNSMVKLCCYATPIAMGIASKSLDLHRVFQHPQAKSLIQNWLMSKAWRLIPFEVRIISCKKKALQPLCIAKNIAWNPFTLRTDEIDESVDCAGNSLVKQGISVRQFGVAFCYGPKGLELADGILALF